MINVMYLVGCYKMMVGRKGRHKKVKAGAACLCSGNNKPFIRNTFKKILSGIYKKAWLILKILSFEVALVNLRLLSGL